MYFNFRSSKARKCVLSKTNPGKCFRLDFIRCYSVLFQVNPSHFATIRKEVLSIARIRMKRTITFNLISNPNHSDLGLNWIRNMFRMNSNW